MITNCIQCQKPIRQGIKFCTHCGASQEVHSTSAREADSLLCTCGNQNQPNQKYCTRCGKALQNEAKSDRTQTSHKINPKPSPASKSVKQTQHKPKAPAIRPLSQSGKKLMLISGIAAVLVIVVIIFLLVPSQPKGELLFTQQLIPSDTDQVIRAKSDLEIVVPSGEIDKPCSIEVRTAPGLPAPDNNAQLINAYNISIDGKKEFESYLDIRMALTDGRPSDFTCLYYNPHNKSWEGIPYSIDASRRQTVISTRHLSIFSLVKQDPSIVPGPMMKLGHTRFPSGRMMSYSNMLRMLQSYRTNSQVDEKEAYGMVWPHGNWYGLCGKRT